MQQICPTCRRQFDEAGFCPFDGAALVAGPIPALIRPASPDQPTLAPIVPDAPPPGAGGERAREVAGAPPPVDVRSLAASAPDPARAPGAAPRDHATQVEVRRRTFPLTPTPGPTVGTGEITRSRITPAPGPSEPPRIRARSASENPAGALELLREPRATDYDKLVGQTLDGRYHVENKIGEGGMGVVFSARHAVIERPLAIKVLKREAMRDSATIRRFVQEAKAASRIGHPNIVDVTDFGTTPDGMTYSVMEFVPGQTLGATLRKAGPFPPARAIRIAAQIARALAAAHDKGIVHRDLKPENVFLVDRDGRPDFVKIVDFGIAKVTPPSGAVEGPRLTRAGSVFGTPEYMAPEQAAGRSDTDGRVDIYALGVILYEMLCGRVPHRGDSMVRTLAMQMLDAIEPPSKVRPDLHIAPELEAVVLRALAKKREQRYQTMGELLDALDAVRPPAIGHSVTGSPVYALAPLPPGADTGVVPAMPPAPLASSEPAQPAPRPAPSPPTVPTVPTVRRVKDEPEFTAGDRPASFEHVFTDELAPPRERRWLRTVLLGAIAAAVAGAAAVTLATRRGAAPPSDRDARPVAAASDAAVPEPPPPPGDAAPDTSDTSDASDAGDLVVIPALDAGRPAPAPPRERPAPVGPRGLVAPAPRDAGPASGDVVGPPAPRGTAIVQVLTRPEGANLYDGFHYRGPGGTQLEEPLGARLVITCRQPGYRPGTVEVRFDGRTEAALCVMTRIKRCIDGLKNPFDDCDPH